MQVSIWKWLIPGSSNIKETKANSINNDTSKIRQGSRILGRCWDFTMCEEGTATDWPGLPCPNIVSDESPVSLSFYSQSRNPLCLLQTNDLQHEHRGLIKDHPGFYDKKKMHKYYGKSKHLINNGNYSLKFKPTEYKFDECSFQWRMSIVHFNDKCLLIISMPNVDFNKLEGEFAFMAYCDLIIYSKFGVGHRDVVQWHWPDTCTL